MVRTVLEALDRLERRFRCKLKREACMTRSWWLAFESSFRKVCDGGVFPRVYTFI